jgi:hypothetical protein
MKSLIYIIIVFQLCPEEKLSPNRSDAAEAASRADELGRAGIVAGCGPIPPPKQADSAHLCAKL